MIGTVLANGACAHRSFPKETLNGRAIIKMPSTSPAYTLPYNQKLGWWRETILNSIKET